jgi:hypothetical protein
MRTERMPWTCRWSQLRPSTPAPLWLEDWMAQWTCLQESRPEVASFVDRCVDCERWETRDERADQPHADRIV